MLRTSGFIHGRDSLQYHVLGKGVLTSHHSSRIQHPQATISGFNLVSSNYCVALLIAFPKQYVYLGLYSTYLTTGMKS